MPDGLARGLERAWPALGHHHLDPDVLARGRQGLDLDRAHRSTIEAPAALQTFQFGFSHRALKLQVLGHGHVPPAARHAFGQSAVGGQPTIWHEYTLDMGTLARSRGLGTCYVTNGYITEEALRELVPMLAAFRVDIKAFSDDFYRKVCGAHLQPVLDAAALARELGMHIETVTLVIPGLNDTMEEQEALIRWVIEHLGPQTPMHFSAFHPDYRMNDRGATPVALLEKICARAKELGLRFPYLGNVAHHRYREHVLPGLRRAAHRADRIFQPHYGSR